LLRKEESQPITCTIKSIAGYSSTLSLKSSADLFLAGVTSTVDQTFVDIPPNGSVNIVVTVTSSSQVVYGAIGYVTVTADDSSKTKTSQIQVRIRNPQIAVFDQGYNSPRCDDYVYQCTSVDLSGSILNGRGNVGPEVNAPNTIDSCQDGGSGTYHSDESLDAITVKRTDGDTTKNMAVGSSVTVEAKVYCYSTGASDWGDFYYASDAANPIWTFIGSVQCPGGGERTLSRSYVLPQGGSSQAVRVNFRYSGSQSPCSGGSYDDTDDIVFAVAPPTPTNLPTPLPTPIQPTPMPTKAPTPAPTKPPTRMPTRTPTKTPTRMPTKACSSITKQTTCIGTTYCTWSTTTKKCIANMML
jgi:cell division septation protein DedD